MKQRFLECTEGIIIRDSKWQVPLYVVFICILLNGSYIVAGFAANDVSAGLSSATDSKGIGILGGQVTYFDKGNGNYGVRIDEIDFSGEWCSHNLLAANRHCTYEIELWKKGELIKEGNWLDEPISKQQVSKDVVTGKLCPSNPPNPLDPTAITILDYYSTTCPSLKDLITDFSIRLRGKYFIKIRMHHNDYTTDWSTHLPVSLNEKPSGTSAPTEQTSKNPSEPAEPVEGSSQTSYPKSNEYTADSQNPSCATGSKQAMCPSSDSCVDCKGQCWQPGSYIYDTMICSMGKWTIKDTANNIEYWMKKGYDLFVKKQYGDALNCYEKALGIDKKIKFAWNQKGNCLWYLKRYDEAIPSYNEAIKIDPNFQRPWHNIGITLIAQGKNQEALPYLENAIRLDSGYSWTWANKSIALKNLGRVSDADIALTRAKELRYPLPYLMTGSYSKSNKYTADSQNPSCVPGSKQAICPSSESCVDCKGQCWQPGYYNSGTTICSQGKWSII